MHLAHDAENNRKDRPFVDDTRHSDFATHLFHNQLADGQAKSTARRVCFAMFFQVVEVDEESAKLFRWDAAAEVLDAELELNVARVSTHVDV